MSLLLNRNVVQLSLASHRAPVLPNRNEASSGSFVSNVESGTAKSTRFASNPALAHLKALGPRLTSAQRKSIALLEKHGAPLGFTADNVGQSDSAEYEPSTCSEKVALQRRASFMLV